VLAKRRNGHPVEYRFLVKEVGSSAAPQPVMKAQIAKTRIGSLLIYAPTGPGDPAPIKDLNYTVNGTVGPTERVAAITNDGWVTVPQESDMSTTGFFTPQGDMIELLTKTLATWTPVDQTGKQTGQTSGSAFAENKHFRIELRVREAGFPATEISGGVLENLAIENTAYTNISHHPSWNPYTDPPYPGVAKLDILQLMGPGNGCTDITTDLDVLVTAAHPNLGSVTLTVTGPTGTHTLDPPPETPAGVQPRERVGTATIPAPPHAWTVASLSKCSYIVMLRAELLLTTGDANFGSLEDFMAFHKA
jgi:hypothetical protein